MIGLCGNCQLRMALLVGVCALAGPAFGVLSGPGGEIVMSFQNSGPVPSSDLSGTILELQSQAAGTTLGAPSSPWTYGCAATTAGMLFGYYDRNGYANMYTGSYNGGVAPISDLGVNTGLIATKQGLDGRAVRGHVDDYWVSYETAGPDPWEGNWAEHTIGDCTADYMGTNQWKWDNDISGTNDANVDGSTTLWSYSSNAKLYDYVPPAGQGLPQTGLSHGMRLFAESRGYSVAHNYTQKIDALYFGGFSLANYQAEIDAGRPVLIQLAGHTMLGVGYDTGSTIQVHDTWDNSVHAMTWGGTYDSMAHQAVTVFQLGTGAAPEPAGLGLLATVGGAMAAAYRLRRGKAKG